MLMSFECVSTFKCMGTFGSLHSFCTSCHISCVVSYVSCVFVMVVASIYIDGSGVGISVIIGFDLHLERGAFVCQVFILRCM